MRFWLLPAAILAFAGWNGASAQTPLEELERRLDSGRPQPREPGFLGLTADDADAAVRGLRVTAVRSAGPAAAAGLQPGDVLVEMERRPLRRLADLGEILKFRAAGESVNLTFERGGQRHVVTARLAPRPAAPPVEGSAPPGNPPRPGVEVAPPAVEEPLPPPAARPSAPREASPETLLLREQVEALRREAAELRRRLEQLERRLAELDPR